MTKEQLLESLLASIKENAQIEIKKEDFNKPLVSMGIDSLYAVEIANDLEEALDVVIDDRDIAKFTSVNAILNYFESTAKAQA